jgi:outer membrane protein assembly factor BamA
MRNELKLLLQDQHRGQTYDANAIEDGAMLILAQLSDEGRLHPRLTIRATPPGGTPLEWQYQIETSTSLPRSWVAQEVEYRVEPGVKYRVAGVEIEGLQALTAREGLAYFQDNSAFAGNPWHREYSPGALRRMQQQLTNALRNLGYAEARVMATDLRINDQTGEVRLRLRVTEGRPWQVAAVIVEDENHGLIAETITQPYVGRPWCELLDHDLTNEVRNACYRQGYPDATVLSLRETGPVLADHQPVSIRLRVVPGPQIRRGAIHFEGAKQTRLILRGWAPSRAWISPISPAPRGCGIRCSP